MFDEARVPIPDQEFDKTVRLAFEKEMLGLYLSDHPLKGLEAALARHVDTTIAELREGGQGRRAALGGGVVTGVVRKYTKRGELMATFTLEDLVSSIEVWVFPRTMTEVGHLLADDAVVCVKGRLDLREEPAKLVCMEIKRPELNADRPAPPRRAADPRPHRRAGGVAEAPAERASRAVAGAAPRRDQVHPAGIAVERRHHPRAAGRAAGPAGPGLPGGPLRPGRARGRFPCGR